MSISSPISTIWTHFQQLTQLHKIQAITICLDGNFENESLNTVNSFPYNFVAIVRIQNKKLDVIATVLITYTRNSTRRILSKKMKSNEHVRVSTRIYVVILLS